MFYEWIDRKLVARFQNRIGPRWFQPFADAVKLFAKEQITPGIVNPYLFFGLAGCRTRRRADLCSVCAVDGIKPRLQFSR